MIFEIYDNNDIVRVKMFLKENDIAHEIKDEAYDSVSGCTIYDILTNMFGANPTLDGDDVVDLVYRRVPSMVEKIRRASIHDLSYGLNDSPYMEMEHKINEYYTGVIEEELALMEAEGIISKDLEL